MNDLSEAIWRMRTVREKTGFGKSTVDRLEAAGQFPRRRQLSTAAVGWLASEVIAWMKARPTVGRESGGSRE